jgi:hypothetical protein
MRHFARAALALPAFALLASLVAAPGPAAVVRAESVAPQAAGPSDALHRPLDQLLDTNVRDGLVYYRALRGERGRLDRYISSLNIPAATYDSWQREDKMAFWVNAYNAFVLQTVIDRYPIHGANAGYPANSIRQIPGAFETIKHRAAGRTLTLDEIEKTVLPEFKEPRLYLALGRGAIGGGRLRSEAYSGARMKQQLDDIQESFVSEQTMLRIDRATGQLTLTPIVSWREHEFVAAYDTGPSGPMAQRSPIERASVAFIMPNVLPLEREFLEKNQFKVTYHQLDWRLNDLTGGRPE